MDNYEAVILTSSNSIDGNIIKTGILERYNISAASLAKLLGIGEATIWRCISNSSVRQDNIDKLRILLNPYTMQKLLYSKQNAIDKALFNKAAAAIHSVILGEAKKKKLPYVTALEVVKYIIKEKFFDPEKISTTKIWFHKLLAFSQAWFVLFYKVPLFEDRICAWKFGFVVDSIQKSHYWDNKTHLPSELLINEANISDIELSSEQKELIKSVFNAYGGFQASILVKISHDNIWQKYWASKNEDKTIPLFDVRNIYKDYVDMVNLKSVEDIYKVAHLQYQNTYL